MQIFGEANIARIVEILKAGGVVVYPTETSYGIGCDATNTRAVARVFLVKHRPEDKGVTVLTPKNDYFLDAHARWHPTLRRLATQHWPGAVNVVVSLAECHPIAPQCMTGDTIAMRRSASGVASSLADALGRPLVSTSANISSEPAMYSADEIVARFRGEVERPDAILDVGVLASILPSTVVAIDEATGDLVLLRQGAIDVR